MVVCPLVTGLHPSLGVDFAHQGRLSPKAGLWLMTRGVSNHCDILGNLTLMGGVSVWEALLLYHRTCAMQPL